MNRGGILFVMCLISRPAAAQVEQVATPPPNLVVSNYNSVPVGPYGGLEGSAYVARIDDPSASWFNPAGLAHQAAAQISGSAGVYQRTQVAPVALPDQGGSAQQLPNFVGFTFSPATGYTVGAALLATNSWNQETDSQLFSAVPSGQQRFAYSADSEFSQRIAAVSVGYAGSGRWRAGGGFAFNLMNLRLVASASDRIATASDLQSLLVTSRASASALQLRGQGGAQFESGRWRLGGAIRTPGATLSHSGSITVDGVLAGGSGSLGASVFDGDAQRGYHLPWEFQGGIAVMAPRAEAEVDIQGYSPIGAYSLLSTSEPLLIYAGGANAPPAISRQSVPALTSASDGVVSVAAGGHAKLFGRRELRVHGGIATNRSPVASADTVFSKVNLLTWSAGMTGTFGKLQFSAGLSRQTGSADDVALRNLLNGDVVHSRIDVRTTGFIYSLAYQF
jgi:hypothetical protein